MQCNVGKSDRMFRIVAGLAMILAGVFFHSWWGAVGLVPLVTAAMGWCPLYVVLGIKTCKAPD